MQVARSRSIGIIVAGGAVAAWLLADVTATLEAQAPRPAATGAARQAWPAWRGPLGTGEAPAAKPPLEWSETKNVRWKVPVPGAGKSSPIVWRDTVYLTTAVPGPGGVQRFTLVAFNRADGAAKWSRLLHEEKPHEGTHPDGSYAAGSALTDGQRLYAWFGSRGLYAVDFAGTVLWEKSFGKMETRNGFGEGSSVAVHDGTLVVPWDHEGADFVIALDAATGKEKWRTPREEPTTWSTPLIVAAGGAPQAVLSGTNRVVGYDLATGRTLWQAGGTTMNAIPTPVFADGLVIAMGGFRGSMARAIRLADARGDVTGAPAQAWTYEKDTPYVPSPLHLSRRRLFPEGQLGHPDQPRRQDRRGALHRAAGGGAQRLRLAGGRRRPHLRRRPRGDDGGARGRADGEGAGDQCPARRHRHDAGAGRRRNLSPRRRAPLPHLGQLI